MKRTHVDGDFPARWRDRPPGGSDEDAAGALARAALAPGALPLELDDRQLRRIEQNLKVAHRPRPPFWLRPALVVLLLTVSVASGLGYQSRWFAPLRARLRFRSIPPVAPEPVRHERKRPAARPAPTAGGDETPPPPPFPGPEPPAAESAPPRPPPPRVVHPPPSRKLAIAENAPPPEPAAPPQVPEEIQALERAMALLRGKHDARAALAALDDYVVRFPNSVLGREARVARIDALLMLDRSDEALRALEALPLDEHRRSTELQLIRGELRARTDCGRAEADFSAVLARVRTATLEERALYGRAACRAKAGNVKAGADDLRRYLARFPSGPHADWARRWLDNND
jgi:hypothetical protein